MDRSSLIDGAHGPSRARTISSHLLLSSQEQADSNFPRESPCLVPSAIYLPVQEPLSHDKQEHYTTRFSSQPCLEQSSKSPTRLNSSTPSLQQPIPQPLRRFTIDDQIAAELEAKADSGQSLCFVRDSHAESQQENDIIGSYGTSKYLSERMHNEQGFECAAVGTQSTSSNQCSGWLPEPIHQIQRFVGQEVPRRNTPFAKIISEIIDEQPTYGAELGPRTNTQGLYISPVKIFGESVGLDETVDDTQNQGQPAYSTNPHLELPRLHIDPSPRPTTRVQNTNAERHIPSANDRPKNHPFSDQPMRHLELYGNTSFTPFRQRLSRQPGQQTIYGQQLPSSTSLRLNPADSRQRSIATSSPDSLILGRTF